MPQKRVALYCRVSTDRQAMTKDGSLETQLARLRRNVELENLGGQPGDEWIIAGEYIDAAQSGKSLDRPELDRLRSDIESGKIDVVLVTKLDRITRSVQDFYELKQSFETHNVAFRSLDEKFDTTSPMGEAMLTIIMVFAQLERRMTAERTREHMRQRALKGLFNGGRPWGYRLNADRKGELLIDEEEARVVRSIFEEYLKLKSLHELQRWMEKQNIRRPEFKSRRERHGGGNVPLVATLAAMLSNPLYIGKLRYKGEVIDAVHQPIFSSEEEMKLWQDVQEKLQRRSPKTNEAALRAPRKEDPLHHYTLKGILYCGCCGAAMTPGSGTSRTGETKFYYTCTTRQKRGSDACSCPSLPAEAIEDALLERVRGLTVDQNLLKALVANADAGRTERLELLRTKEEQVRRRLVEVGGELSPLIDAVKSGGAGGFRAVQEEMQRLEGIREELEIDLVGIVDQRKLLTMDRLSDDVILTRYRDLKDVLDRADGQELAMLLSTIIRRIDWHPDPEGSRGGRYKMVLYALPLIPMNLSPEHSPGDTVGSHYCLSWLPHLDSNQEPTD